MIKKSISRIKLFYLTLPFMFSAFVTNLACSDTGASVGKDIFNSNGFKKAVEEFAKFYKEKLFLVMFLVSGVIALAFVKDEKAKKYWIGGWIGTVVAYIVCVLTTGGVVGATAETISKWF